MPKQDIQEEFEKLIVRLTQGGMTKDRIISIRKAWDFAKVAHQGQARLSGEEYIWHPFRVAQTLAKWNLDSTSIIAGLLHDTVEDCNVRIELIAREFGVEVAEIVEGVTKVTSLRLKGSKKEEFVENLRKMLLVMARDLRVVLVKLADRYHNMQTLWPLSEDSQKENARETLEIYAPLSERLGIGEIKGELEDLAFPYVYKDEYRKVATVSKPHYKEAEEHIVQMEEKIGQALEKKRISHKLNARKKHYYSLWKKLERPEINWDFGKVNDIVAVRILLPTIEACYAALGVVHSLYKPVPSIGISDFIAQPKPNGYRSIHTKVFGPGGRIVEVQIRTYEMHDQAEHGIAAHWAYSEIKSKGVGEEKLEKGVAAEKNKLAWVRQLVDWQNQMSDTEEFLEAVKFDALSHRNFVFSPEGDVFDLPSGATCVDFAFAVHTDLGKYIAGARVDGRIVPLDYQLKSGQVVEILKAKNPCHPKRDWLDFVVTTNAKREIKKAIR